MFNKDKIDVVLIDDLHTHKQSLKDVENCLKYLSEKGFIVMHDCNPVTESSAYPVSSYERAEKSNLKGWTGKWCGDVWKTIVYLRLKRQYLNIFVLNCDYGVGIITKGKSKNTLNRFNINIKNLSYKYLKKNRKKLLNLKNENYFYKFLKLL